MDTEARLNRIVDGRTDLVFDHLAAGHSAEAEDEHGVSLLRWCAYYGDVSAIRCLLQHGARLASLGTNFDLNGAAFHGHWRLCQFLLEQGADPDHALPQTGETPLHAALCKRDRPTYDHVVELLLAYGARLERATIPGVETGSFMRDARTKGERALHRAAAFGNPKSIRLLLEAGADREARDAHGDTPLSWASWHGRPAHVLELLCFGAHRIHPDAVAASREASSPAWSNLDLHLLGQPHCND